MFRAGPPWWSGPPATDRPVRRTVSPCSPDGKCPVLGTDRSPSGNGFFPRPGSRRSQAGTRLFPRREAIVPETGATCSRSGKRAGARPALPQGDVAGSGTVDVDDRLGERLRGFLRQVVPDAAGDEPVRIFARELAAIGGRVRVRRAVGVAFEGDRGHGDDGTCGKSVFQVVIFALAVSQAEPPAVIVNNHVDVIGVVERHRRAIECRVVEVPLRRSKPPDELREIVPVFVVAGPAAFRREIELIPPFQLGLRRSGFFPDAWLPIR